MSYAFIFFCVYVYFLILSTIFYVLITKNLFFFWEHSQSRMMKYITGVIVIGHFHFKNVIAIQLMCNYLNVPLHFVHTAQESIQLQGNLLIASSPP